MARKKPKGKGVAFTAPLPLGFHGCPGTASRVIEFSGITSIYPPYVLHSFGAT